jgi:hypothetical protein
MFCLDLAFVIASGISDFAGQPFNRWHVGYDGGFPEKYQYAKWAIMIAALLGIYHQRRTAIYLAWAALFAYFLFDDSMMFHETAGLRIGDYFGIPAAFGLQPVNFGELIVTALAAVPLLGLIALSYAKNASPADRAFSNGLFFLVLALVFFGMVIDELDVVAPFQVVRTILMLAEDGGEMAVASVMVCYTAMHIVANVAAPVAEKQFPGVSNIR